MKITFKILAIFLFLTVLTAARPTPSYAYWGHGHVWVGVGWPGPYYYGAYPYYDPYYYPYYSPSYVVASTSYQPVVVNGVTYYVNNGVYYIYTQYGYQAVAAPAGAPAVAVSAPIAAAPAVQAATVTAVADNDDAFTVNVPNDKGSYTTVILKRSGNGFIGPQGEFYSEFPKIAQLKLMYGK